MVNGAESGPGMSLLMDILQLINGIMSIDLGGCQAAMAQQLLDSV